jgi:hypothetical protein
MTTPSLERANRHLIDARVRWADVDVRVARQTPRVLDLLREACLVEAYLPVFLGRMMAIFWDDIDATSCFTIEAIEAYVHFEVLRRYLERVGHRPISDAEIVAVRRRGRRAVSSDPIRELVNFMGTEHFAAYFFAMLAEDAAEPVLKDVLRRFSAEEEIHSQFAMELLAARLARDPGLLPSVVEHARSFRHVGAYALGKLTAVREDDIAPIQALNRKYEELLGRPLSDFLVGEALR